MANKKNSTSTQVLPSLRLSIEKQIEILKAFATYYSEYSKGATYSEISNLTGFYATNVSGSLKFWNSIGILRQNESTYEPTPALIDFNDKIQLDNDEAWKVLKSALSDQWFVTQTKLKFRIKSEISLDDLIKLLGGIAKVPDNKNNTQSLKYIVDLLELCKIIAKQENKKYKLVNSENKSKKIIVDETKDMVQIKIGYKTFAIDVDKIRDFVESNGKQIGTDINRL